MTAIWPDGCRLTHWSLLREATAPRPMQPPSAASTSRLRWDSGAPGARVPARLMGSKGPEGRPRS